MRLVNQIEALPLNCALHKLKNSLGVLPSPPGSTVNSRSLLPPSPALLHPAPLCRLIDRNQASPPPHMAEVAAALPPLAPPPASPPPLAPDDAPQPASPGSAPMRLPVFQRHTASSRSHALVDPDSETAGEIRALMRREPAATCGRLPQLGAGGAADYVRHGGSDLRELVARKRQVGWLSRSCTRGPSCGHRAPAVPAPLPHPPRPACRPLHALPCPALQIFLAQMSLDTKHSEIAKLEQRAHQREEALLVGADAGLGRLGELAEVLVGLEGLHAASLA